MLDAWLDITLDSETFDSEPNASQRGRVPGGRYHIIAPGVLELVPDRRVSDSTVSVISAGIHGDETAPIELLGDVLARLEAGLYPLGAPVLLILGNPPAIKQATRYVDTNLNRLFKRDVSGNSDEHRRARLLMQEVEAFFDRHDPERNRPRLHYDLHTAIRTSRYPRFAVEPFAAAPTLAEQWQLLAGAGIQAVLSQHTHSWTFSHFSRHYLGAQGFTLELGQVAPFGANDLAPLVPMRKLLEALLAGRPARQTPAESMAFFTVVDELIRESSQFELCFPDDTANFTAFAPGTVLARDAKAGVYRVPDNTPLCVVFPNARVETGARAALLVHPVAPPAIPQP
ncbi:succinylglutamate desuccinylase [Phytohalomonas tamaricis]|uniref:succinylglutamate desuccinylase n=1 Tax=Phytohalomonas tamaricis TaxID=2081032 RepID=UPI000D0BB0E6|nr:succinylglutamate desuccinylase [Phytohalomonas tamaricis]